MPSKTMAWIGPDSISRPVAASRAALIRAPSAPQISRYSSVAALKRPDSGWKSMWG